MVPCPGRMAGCADRQLSRRDGRRTWRVPAAVLSRVAAGRPALLVLDQVDAFGAGSGRNPARLEAVAETLREARALSVRVLLACRAFDLEVDPRLAELAGVTRPGRHAEGHHVQQLAPLPAADVDEALHGAGINPGSLTPSLRRLLGVPLHPQMLVTLQERGQIAAPHAKHGCANRGQGWRPGEEGFGRKVCPVPVEARGERMAGLQLGDHRVGVGMPRPGPEVGPLVLGEPLLGDARELEQQHVPGFFALREPGGGECGGVPDRQDDKSADPLGVQGGQRPCDAGSPACWGASRGQDAAIAVSSARSGPGRRPVRQEPPSAVARARMPGSASTSAGVRRVLMMAKLQRSRPGSFRAPN